VLPTFSGSLNVTGEGDASSPGLPIELKTTARPSAPPLWPSPRREPQPRRRSAQ
jgi:hypothetical protein